MSYAIRALDEATWDAFHEEDCRNEAGVNRERKLARVRAGTAFDSPAEMARIKNRAMYEKSATTPPDWRIGRSFVGKGLRRRGIVTAALADTLELIAGLGGGTVEGYPEPSGFLFHGALSTYEKLGFVRDRKIGKHRWVMRKTVEPRG